MLTKVAEVTRALGKYPTAAALKLYAKTHPGVPAPQALQRHFRTREQTIAALITHCESNGTFADVLELVRPLAQEQVSSGPEKASGVVISGHVYLMKSGKHYKIGRSNHVGRREYQIALQMPEAVTTVHSIATDDPEGIEAYWHNRFKSKRAGGEWFSLNSSDLKAFRARRFM